MKTLLFPSLALVGAGLLSTPVAARANDADVIPSSEVLVIGHNEPAAQAAADAALRPGNVSVVPAEAFQDRYAVTLRDSLQLTPGVIAQPRFGEEVRLSIRGSGLANNAHLRGVELLFDGVPINGADGFGDFQELDQNFVSHLQVNRGANAFATGATSLGGSIEFVGLSARGASEQGYVRLDGGSYGTARAHGRMGYAGARFDALIAGTAQAQDGFRGNAQQSNGRLYANAGWRWSERIETRFGLLGNDVNQEIPGQLTIAQALASPERAAPGNNAFGFSRDINSWRGWSATTIDLGEAGEITVGGAYSDRQLYHPISVVIDQRTTDGLAFARYDGAAAVLGAPLEWTLGARWRDARTAARTFAAAPNRLKARGALIGHTIQDAGGLEVFGEARATVVPSLTLIAGLNSVDADRDLENLRNPAASDSASFEQVIPKFGALFAPNPAFTVFANVSGVYEPPTFGQLTQGGFVDFVPIEAQEGTSYEIGARGAFGRVRYEVTVYDARLENEFIAFQVSPLTPAATDNAGDTIHRGIEAGLAARLFDDMLGGALTLQGAWTHNDFRFDGDAIYGDNDLAGAPRDTLVAELAWTGARLRVAPSVFTQSDTVVDFENTLEAPGYTLWNLSASFAATSRLTVYLEGRNLTDEAYISMVNSIANAAAPGANLAVATPGDGLAVYGGVRLRFGART